MDVSKGYKAAVTKREEQQREKRHTFRMELIMVIATVLSAIATVAAVCVGYFQYQAAHDALSAGDRNRVFEAYVNTLSPVCDLLSERRESMMMAEILRSFLATADVVKRDDTGRELLPVEVGSQRYKEIAPQVSEALKPLMPSLRSSLQRFKIWARSADEPGIATLNELTRAISILSYTPSVGLLSKENTAKKWAQDFVYATTSCSVINKQLVPWFRDGVPLNINEYEPQPEYREAH